MIGCFYDHGQWVALHLQSHPETGDTLVVARLGECPGDADGHDVPLAPPPDRRRRPRPGAAPAHRRLASRLRRAAGAARERASGDRPPVRAAARRGRSTAPARRAQARAVVAYAATADRRGFCFFGNPAAR